MNVLNGDDLEFLFCFFKWRCSDQPKFSVNLPPAVSWMNSGTSFGTWWWLYLNQWTCRWCHQVLWSNNYGNLRGCHCIYKCVIFTWLNINAKYQYSNVQFYVLFLCVIINLLNVLTLVLWYSFHLYTCSTSQSYCSYFPSHLITTVSQTASDALRTNCQEVILTEAVLYVTSFLLHRQPVGEVIKCKGVKGQAVWWCFFLLQFKPACSSKILQLVMLS